ncbi:MAG TPA: flagellar protein FlgN [Epulopiscium sp.]|nr:flagellar protein FlgN [Candidatus Epulonipiscium sp.]
MAGLVHELIEILDEQKECYEGLLTLAQYKTDSIVNREMEFLEDVLKREQEFIGRAARLEKNREDILKDISNVLNLNLKELTISNIILKLDKTPVEQEKLRQLRKDLLGIVEEIKQHNMTNEGLINQSLEFIDFTLHAIQSINSYPSSGYQNEGDDIKQPNKSFFDAKQ